MSNEIDETPSSSHNKESYGDLINEEIDRLNESQAYRGTGLKNEEVEKADKKTALHSWWYKALLGAAAFSLGMSIYYNSSEIKAAYDEFEAEKDLKAFFGDAYDELIDAINGTAE